MAGKRLGRGLQFLLSDRTGTAPEAEAPKADGAARTEAQPKARKPPSEPESSQMETSIEGALLLLEPASLQPNPFQPRRTFDPAGIEELARSLRTTGLLQPIVVRAKGDGWEIIAGERRVRAALKAGLVEVPALVRDATDQDMRRLALIENIQRTDLDPIEKALSFQDLKTSTGWTHERIARDLGMDRSSISNLLRLLDLPASVRSQVRSGALAMGHARALLAAPETEREALAERVVAGGLSVRETEQLANSLKLPAEQSGGTKKRGKAAWQLEMERNLMGALGCHVRVSGRSGKGRITLEVGTREEFDRVYELLMNGLPVPSDDELVRRKSPE